MSKVGSDQDFLLPSDEEKYRESKQNFLINFLAPIFSLQNLENNSKSNPHVPSTYVNAIPARLGAARAAFPYPEWIKDKSNEIIEFIWIGKNSRRRVNFQIDYQNNLGFFAKKSHDLIIIKSYEIAEAVIDKSISELQKFLKKQEQNIFTQLTITSFDNGLDLIFVCKKEPNLTQQKKIIEFAKTNEFNASYRFNKNLIPLFLVRKNQIFLNNLKIEVPSDAFLQATKSGLETIVKIIREQIIAQKFHPKKIADIYSGFGAYSFALHDLANQIYAFEGEEKLVDVIKKNCVKFDLNQKIIANCRDIFIDPLSVKELKNFDSIIINPPRNGATPQILEIAKSNIKFLHYVSCSPQSFLRDAKILIDANFQIKRITAIDQFYSTDHIELVANFQKN